MNSKAAHSHTWLVGIVGLAVGLTLMIGFPKLKAVAGVVFLVVLFHLVGLAVLAGSVYSFAPVRVGRIMERSRAEKDDKGYDFGWSWGAMNGHWLAAAALVTMAVGLGLEWPGIWAAWSLLLLLGVSCFVGGVVLRTSKRTDFATLPLVRLFGSEQDLVLDAGCGGGRTTLAVSRVLPAGRIVALDRFDANYIDGGGRKLLERNLRIAGLADRVQIQPADMTAIPFPDSHFDAAVSAHAIDHMKDQKKAGLAEIRRVLKPGGRFLMVVWVPGWITFSLANVFSFLLTTKAGWRQLASEVGFSIQDEGTFNGMWFAVLERTA